MLDPDIASFYARGAEDDRLARGLGRVELARTQELALRHLPPPPACVLDVGGGTGVYSRWLAGRGYDVRLIDPVAAHVERARAAGGGVADCSLGDARRLDLPAESADAVLLLGPLYHLLRREERLGALKEAARVLKPGGTLLAAAVSRYASMLSVLKDGLTDPAVHALVDRVLENGEHLNPTNHPEYFTTAYFHEPAGLREEVEAAGLRASGVFGVEGPASFLPDLDAHWLDPQRRARLLALARSVEAEPSLIGSSAHLLAVAVKPA